MSATRVLITCPQMQRAAADYEALLDGRGIRAEQLSVEQQASEDELVEIIGRFDGVIVGDDPMTERVLRAATRLRVISKWGVGIDNIDLAAAAALGIRVTNTPDVFADEVADVAIGYLILIARQLHTIDRLVRGGSWAKIEGTTLAGRTLGVIGLGSIGRATARRAVAHGMNVVGTDPLPGQQAAARAFGVRCLDLEELLTTSDAISIHCPLTPETYHLLNARTLALLPAGAWVINTARGRIIDEEALAEALVAGSVGAAALDVFENEPLPETSPLRTLETVILGAHNASNTRQAVERVNALALENLLRGLEEVSR